MRLWSFPSMHEPYLGNTSCALRLFGVIWQFNLFYLPSDKTRPWQRKCGFDSPKKFAENIFIRQFRLGPQPGPPVVVD